MIGKAIGRLIGALAFAVLVGLGCVSFGQEADRSAYELTALLAIFAAGAAGWLSIVVEEYYLKCTSLQESHRIAPRWRNVDSTPIPRQPYRQLVLSARGWQHTETVTWNESRGRFELENGLSTGRDDSKAWQFWIDAP